MELLSGHNLILFYNIPIKPAYNNPKVLYGYENGGLKYKMSK